MRPRICGWIFPLAGAGAAGIDWLAVGRQSEWPDFVIWPVAAVSAICAVLSIALAASWLRTRPGVEHHPGGRAVQPSLLIAIGLVATAAGAVLYVLMPEDKAGEMVLRAGTGLLAYEEPGGARESTYARARHGADNGARDRSEP